MEYITLTYKDVTDLLRDLKQIGANTLLAGGSGNAVARHSLTGKGRLAAMRKAYAAYRTGEGLHPATYEIVYGLAWGRDPAVQAIKFMPRVRSTGQD
jgi:malonyl-CoA O-methyltransferase